MTTNGLQPIWLWLIHLGEEALVINKDFSDFSLSKTGVLSTRLWGAYFKLKSDIKSIFPYLNASISDARFYDRPECIQFYFNGIKCTLYPKELVAASFINKQAALDFFERLMDYIADLYRKRDSIQPDYRKYRPPSVIDILKLLPKSNCKKCGYATCLAFASALRKGETRPDCCTDFAAPINISKEYPVFDDKGDLAATIAIDFDVLKESSFIDPDENAGIPPLTQREIQVLKYITDGATNPEIAKLLSISPHTVKSHVIHIFNKLGVNDRTQAAVWATRYNLEDEHR